MIAYTCNYCYHKWNEESKVKYSWDQEATTCPKCKDSNLRKESYTTIDTYPETKANSGRPSKGSTPKTC